MKLLRRFIVIAGLVVAVTPLSASAESDAADVRDAAKELAVAQLEATADSRGALGLYFDEAAREFVVVLPEAAAGRFKTADVASLGLAVRVETRKIDRETVETIEDEVVALRPDIPLQFGYSVAFNPESGLVEIASDAPRGHFSAIEKRFPGLTTFRTETFETAAGTWSSDTPPHWGGAYLNGNLSCTSGFVVRNQSTGTRYMVTAGHCNPNGTTTNMGTAVRHSDVYPGLDVGLIRGKTYGGYIYADGATGERAVADANNPVLESSYCMTGRSSGFTCSWVPKQKGVKVCYPAIPEGCTYNLYATKKTGNAVIQLGDSGGPLYIKAANLKVGVRGIVSGRSSDLFGNWTSYFQGARDITNMYVYAVVVP